MGQRGILCPFHISLFFQSNQLIQIKLTSAENFSLLLYGRHPEEEAVISWLTSFFQGKQLPFPLPLSIVLPPFGRRVLEELQMVPFGERVTYGELAERSGSPRAARAVGNVCNANPFPLVIPCHRVVQSDGKAGGFAYGSKMKRSLLDFEDSFLEG